jgi:hypothetical protein
LVKFYRNLQKPQQEAARYGYAARELGRYAALFLRS